MDRKYWTLLALGAAQGKALTPVQLQKTLFLLGEAFPDKMKNFYNFEPYNYGPFDVDIYGDAKILAQEGLVNIDMPNGRRWCVYSCTSDGLIRVEQVAKNIPREVWQFLRKIVDWIFPLSFSQIVSAVYAAYPKMKVNSVFKDQR